MAKKLFVGGLSFDTTDEGLQQAGIDWFTRAAEVRDKKFSGQTADNWEDRARQSRFLDYRGFTAEQIESARYFFC